MNDIVLNGETLEMSNVIDTIVIEGFDHTFTDGKVESDLVLNIEGGGSSTLITKTFDQNGTYSAATYSADGFSEVTVDVPGDDTNIWQGTKSDFSNLAVRNPKTIYVVLSERALNNSQCNYLYQVWVGNTRIFPPIKDGYDFSIENYDCLIWNTVNVPRNWIDTGIELNSSETYDKNFQIEFKISDIYVISGDHVICGTMNDRHPDGIKEIYVTKNGILYIYETSNGDRAVSSGSIINEDVIIKRINSVYEIYQNGTKTNTISAYSSYGSSEPLGIGVYSSSYSIGLYIDYFRFKWLD